MKQIKTILLLAALITTTYSCKRDQVVRPEVNASTNKTKYSVMDSVRFTLTGDADMITFYSGEQGNEFKHLNRVELEGGDLLLNIETNVLYGIQENNLRLLLSTDFSGTYTKESVESATWTDISERLDWSAGTRLVSKDVSISDLLKSGQPVYFAFKYAGAKSTTGSAQQRTWRVYQFNVKNRFSETEIIPVTTRAEASWQAVNILSSNPDLGVWNLTGYADMVTYVPESNLNDVEKWIISKRFDPNKVTPDKGKAIKKYPDSPLIEYKHAFSKPGEYEVTFVFTNGNYKDIKETIKTLKVVVE